MSTTPAFNPGDIVRVNRNAPENEAGTIGTVLEIRHDTITPMLGVHFRDINGDETIFAYHSYELDLIARAPRPELIDLEKYRPGDEFPNVGYVRRMLGLLGGSLTKMAA